MQLVFLWMNMEKSPIHDIQLQFSPQHPCAFDFKNRVLRKNETSEEVNIFSRHFTDISNVTAIVGENGCGKTSIIKEMFEFLRKGDNHANCLALYYGRQLGKKQDSYYWWSNLNKETKGKRTGERPFTEQGFGGDLFPLKIEDVEDEFFFIRYTDVLSLSEYAKQDLLPTRNSCDLTIAYRFINCKSETEEKLNQSTRDVLLQLYHEETENQIQALSEAELPFQLEKLTITPCKELEPQDVMKNSSTAAPVWENIGADIPQREKGRNLCTQLLYDMNSWENITAIDLIIRSVIYVYLRHSIRRFGIYSENASTGAGIAAAISREFNVPIVYWKKGCSAIRSSKDMNEFERFFRGSFKGVGVPGGLNLFVKNLRLFADKLLNSRNIYFDDETKKFYVDLQKMTGDELLEMYGYYRKSIGQYGEAFSYEMEMSSGERALFNLWAYMRFAKRRMEKADIPRIIRENKQPSEPNRSVIIFFDELDAFLHPRWQQNSINWMLNNVSKIFSGHEIQVIFSTHSPILLSDIPLRHVIYLGKNEGMTKVLNRTHQTFADNIYHLYLDSFFLSLSNDGESNVWLHGTFAKEIIEKLWETINAISISDENEQQHGNESKMKIKNSVYSMEELYLIIKMIGEPFLQRLLMSGWHRAQNQLKTRSIL